MVDGGPPPAFPAPELSICPPAVHMVSPLEDNLSHCTWPRLLQEPDLGSWGYREEGAPILMACESLCQ